MQRLYLARVARVTITIVAWVTSEEGEKNDLGDKKDWDD